jgi:hypothetical protein
LTVSCVAVEELLLKLQYLNVRAILVASSWGDAKMLGDRAVMGSVIQCLLSILPPN